MTTVQALRNSQETPAATPVQLYVGANREEDAGRWGEFQVLSLTVPTPISLSDLFVKPSGAGSQQDLLGVELAKWEEIGIETLSELDTFIDDLEDLEADEEG